jgi:hypothetical protein
VDRILRNSLLQNRIRIQNNWKPLTDKLLQYNKSIVDDVIINQTDINLEVVNQRVNSLFDPAILKTYQTILMSPLVASNKTNKIWLEGQAKQITQMIGVEYTERIGKNIDAVQKILKETEVNISKYEKMTKEFPKADRLKIVKKCFERGENYKGHKYSYKELNNMNKGITKYIDNRAQQDKYELNHNEATANGKTPHKKEKTWVWSGLKRTRHSGMDGETVPLKDTFTVINEREGDTDELLFPGDFHHDRNGCSNICNCGCEVVYL